MPLIWTGREINVIFSGNLTPGDYEFEFNASAFASGVYFYCLSARSFYDTKMMVLIK